MYLHIVQYSVYTLTCTCTYLYVQYMHACLNMLKLSLHSAVQLDNDVKSSVPGKMITPSAPSKPSWNVNDLLTVGQVFMLDDGSHVASLQLPAEFWRQTDNVPLTSQLMQQLEKDFKWY